MKPVKVTSKKIRELAQKAQEILAAIDGGASEEVILPSNSGHAAK
ncbi:TPA: hypothetical protein ACUAG7_004813 [Escherichia coli]